MTKNAPPSFILQSIYEDGTVGDVEVVPVTHVPLDTKMDRRAALRVGGVLGTGVSAALLFNSSEAAAQGQWKTKADKAKPAPPAKVQAAKAKPAAALPAKVLAHRVGVTTIAVSRDGQLLISGDRAGTIKLWSVPEAKLIRSKKVGSGAILATAFDRNSKTATVVSSRSIRRWSLDSGRLRRDTSVRRSIKAVAFAPDQSFLVFATASGTVQLYRPQDKVARQTSTATRGAIHEMSISADGRLLVVSKRSSIELYSLPDLTKITEIEPSGTKARRHIDISPDQRQLAVSREQSYGIGRGKISLLQLPDAELQSKLKTFDRETGPLYTFGTTEKKLEDGQLTGHNSSVYSIEYLSQGPFLISGGAKSRPRRRFNRSRRRPLPTAPSDPAGRETIKIWSTKTRALLQSLEGNSQVSDLALDEQDLLLASSGKDGTIMIWDRERTSGDASFKFRTYLFDPKTMNTNQKAAQFNVLEQQSGVTTSYTLPCGSPIPASAVCTCNCVPGTYSRPVRRPVGRRRGRTYCSCNKICTCVPVCQAHKLLHGDRIVRHMAEQLLSTMGRSEFEYMRWAASCSSPRLRDRINVAIDDIDNGAQPALSRWPTLNQVTNYLDHHDEVVAIMAAQMSTLVSAAQRIPMTEETHRQVQALLRRSYELCWRNRKPR